MEFNLSLEKVNYIKITCLDNENNACFLRASLRSIGEQEIFACSKFEDEINIPYPQEVSVSFVCDDGLYYAETTVKFVENNEPYIFFTIQTPQQIEYQQNREYFRVQTDKNVLLSFNDTVIPCRVYDISANGIRLVLDECLEIPEIVQLNILFDEQEIKTRARYIRTDNEDNIWKSSFNFLNISEHDIDFISKKCIQIQLSNRHKEQIQE